MYPNAASTFILGFISPTPLFSEDDAGGDGGVIKMSDNEWKGGTTESCEILMSGTSGNGTLFFSHQNIFNDGSGGGTAGGWESSGNPSEQSGGDGIIHRGGGAPAVESSSGVGGDNTDIYNNYHHHYGNRLSSAALTNSALNNNFDGGGAGLKDGSGTFCPIDWDDVLCWPKTAAGDVATMACFDNFHGIPYNSSGFARRLCMEGGIWNRTEYSECKPFAPSQNMTTDTGNLDITTGIYLFGYCLSLLALIIAAVIFISFKELRCLRNTIHSHLTVTYLLADSLWVLSVISTNQGRNVRHTTQATCFTFILLHYFHLTNFFWMFVEGLYLYVLVVQTFMTASMRLRTYVIIGWGLPLLVVLVWIVIKWATLSDETMKMIQVAEAEFNSVVCPWLHANQYDWIYISSALIVLAANMVFLLQIMWVLITKLRSATSQETQQSRKAAKALVVLMPLLGITYVLVLIGPKKLPAFEHIRAFLLSTQGFLVALLYCFLNAEVRMAIRHRWNRLDFVSAGYRCNCLSCLCPFEDSSQRAQNLRDWSPRSRTESIRLYTPTSQIFRKRESSASDTTTMTALGGSSLNGGGGGSTTVMTGNGNIPVIPSTMVASIQGKRIATSVRLPTTFAEESDLV